MSVDPRRTQPFCDPRCYRECRCSRWPDYKNRFGEYVVPHPEDTWTPADPLPGSGLLPEHWYRSDGPLWQDAGITPAVADNDPVGRWEDLTANADHVNQAVVGSKPSLQNGAGDLLNGHPVIRFDGTDDFLAGAFAGGNLPQPNTILAVVTHDTGAGIDHFMDDDTLSTVMRAGIAVGNVWQINAGVALSSIGAADANWHIWTILFNGATSQFWHGGVSIAGPGNAGAGIPNGLTIGAQGNHGSNWDGDIAEILIYHANLSDADKNQVAQYLSERYGLAYTDI